MRGKNQKEGRLYLIRAKRKIVYDAAARAWSLGVPWAEALKMSQRAVRAGNAVEPKPFAKGRGKGKAKGRGKGKAR